MTRNGLLSHVNFIAFATLFLGAIEIVAGLFEQCNHIVELSAGQKVYINSPYYPAKYPVGTSCRYTVHAPLDYKLRFECNVRLNVEPTAPRCQSEIFYFNGEGSEVLTGSEYFCGSAEFERKSFLNRAVISYISQPLFKRTLLANTEAEASDDESEVDQEIDYEADTVTTTSMSSIPELNMRDENFANSFRYLTELLTTNVTTAFKMQPTTTNASPALSAIEEAELPMSAWRKNSNASATGKFTNKYESSKYPERISRIVSPNVQLNDTQYYGYFGSKGGGRFSCLVEVVEPPCDCGWTMSLKISGATGIAGINEFPSMAGVKTLKLNRIFCGAAIIHHRYLVSAAHCFMAPETNRSDLIRVVVGENDISTVLESLYTRTYEIDAIITHEQFYSTTRSLRNDIALLRTRLPIEWNRSVAPACLPFLAFNVPGSDIPRKLPLPGQRLETAGWGTTSFGGAQSMQLLKTTLDVFSTSQCRRILRTVPPGVFCTFTPGHDTCQYDSGGALYVRTERLFAVGIVSYGFACAAQQPSVNTRIASFLKWIKAKTPEVRYCIK